PLRADDPALGVVDRGLNSLDVASLAFLNVVLFDVLEDFPSFDDSKIVVSIFFRQTRRNEIKVGLAQDLLRWFAHRLEETSVAEDEAAIQILSKDAQGQRFDQAVIEGLGIFQSDLCPSAVGDVAEYDHPALEFALVVPQR